MDRASQGKLHQQARSGDYAQEDINQVFPGMRKLLEYGALQVKDTSYDYKLYFINSQGSPMLLFGLAIKNPTMIQDLLTQYQTAERQETRERLFAMKISDMTGAEFAEYLTLLEDKKSAQ